MVDKKARMRWLRGAALVVGQVRKTNASFPTEARFLLSVWSDSGSGMFMPVAFCHTSTHGIF